MRPRHPWHWSWPSAACPRCGRAFVDRAYTAEGTLVPRATRGAVITSP
ncbi:LamB/YcsF family protein, partial [Streptomyces sp. TRM49041]